MKLDQIIEIPSKRLTFVTVAFFFLLINGFIANAQSISRVQNFNSGSFISFGQGGTITVSPDYVVTKTGDIILKSNPSPAIFDLYVEALKTVRITYDKKITLNGNHGGAIILALTDPSSTGDGTIVTGSSPTRITLGGTLTIGPSSVTPGGLYSGFLQVIITVNN